MLLRSSRWVAVVLLVSVLASLMVTSPRPSVVWQPSFVHPAANASGVEPGVARLKADQVWPYYQGEGITVAIVGPGVDFQHPALARQYRGRAANGAVTHDYNWADFYSGTPYPTDPTGNGTFYAALMVGDDGLGNQVGVAPAARWIAVRAVTLEERHAAFRWLLAPCRLDGTACDPQKAPQVVLGAFFDNDPSLLEEFRDDIAALHNAGIVTVFAVGNAHQGACGSALPPATLEVTLGVGAVDANDAVAEWSGRGSSTGPMKPDLVAPGVEVRSAAPSGYVTRSSTVASAAYVAGILALLKEANPSITPAEAYSVLRSTAQGIAGWCGSGSPTVPNNVYGWGIPDALRAVTSTATTGRLRLTVTSNGGLPMAGVPVALINEADLHEQQVLLDAQGKAAVAVVPGSYTVSVREPRHYPATVSNVTVRVLTGGEVSIALEELPTFTVEGQLLDDKARALAGEVEFEGPDGVSVMVDGQGHFSVQLHQGRYTYHARSPGWETASGQFDLAENRTLNLTLAASSRMLIVHHGRADLVLPFREAALGRELEVDVVDAFSSPLPGPDQLSDYRYVVWLDGSDVLERASELANLLRAGGGVAVLSEDLGRPELLDSDLAPALGVDGYYPDISAGSLVTVTLSSLAARGPYPMGEGLGPDGWVVASGGVTGAVAGRVAVGVARDGPGRSLLLGISLARLGGSNAFEYLVDRVTTWITGLSQYRVVQPLFPDVVPDRGDVRFIVDLPFDPSGWVEIRAGEVFSQSRSRRIFRFRAVDGAWPRDPSRLALRWTFRPRGAAEAYLWARKGDGNMVFLGTLSGANFAPGLPTLLDAALGGAAVGPVRALADRGLTELPAGSGMGAYGFGEEVYPSQSAMALVRSLGWLPPPGRDYLDIAARLGIYNGPALGSLSRGDVLVMIHRAMLYGGYWRNDIVPVDPPSTASCPKRPGPCTVRIYPGLQSADRELRLAVGSYLHYVGGVPGADPRLHPEDPLQWAAPAERGWFARVLWKALQHRESVRGRLLPLW